MKKRYYLHTDPEYIDLRAERREYLGDQKVPGWRLNPDESYR